MERKMAAAICGIFVAAGMAGCSVHTVENDVWCEATESTSLGNDAWYGATGSASLGNDVWCKATESTAVEDDGASDASGTSAACYGAAYVSGVSTEAQRKQCSIAFQPYSQYGMVYDEGKDELRYHGKLVRWFEDYYPLGEEESGGLDFFNENGVVDVHAVRDFGKTVTNGDGSANPAGKLAGLELFSDKEFAARDIEAIKNPPVPVAYAGGEPSREEMEKIAKEYEPFGVTYDYKRSQWYLNGEKVRYFEDILTSNEESLNGGKFSGSMRLMGTGDGSIDIESVRDFGKRNAEGNGTLIGIKKCSQEEFDKRTQEGGVIYQEQ